MATIETNNLEKKYSTKSVVDKINLSVEAGRVFGFLGPNGAGKTTTIRMLLGLVRPNSGTAKILGFDVSNEFHKISSNISAIVETPTFFPNLTAIQTLKSFSDYCNLNISTLKIEGFLDKCGILFASKQKVDTFSLGMKQRLGIAVALLNNPKVIFLDEPTNGLDPDGIVKTRKLIRRLADEEKKTIFVSSHLLNEVEQMCDDVAILNLGKILVSGKVKQLLNNCKILIKATPIFESKQILQQTFPELDIEIDHSKEKMFVNAKPEQIPQIIEKLVRSKINIYEVSNYSQSLEQFFHKTIELDQ